MSLKIDEIKEAIENGNTAIGIELGSTRIKAIMVNENNKVIASGSYSWENSLVDLYWSYSLEEAWRGIQESYKALKTFVYDTYDLVIKRTGAIGISGMMHGYLVFDNNNDLLVPFRTWRNNRQKVASDELTALFNYPIPQRWSVAHLYQAMLNKENHISNISFQTTLAGYIHWKLTGQKVIGVGEASGMFPIDLKTCDYNTNMIEQFNAIAATTGYELNLCDTLPKVLVAGQEAGNLTEEGAKLIDPTGELQMGIPLCPPEGDAGTGMVATNSVSVKTGNVSAGTSIFAMIVLEKGLTKVYSEIDQVTTPSGNLVAMVHSNNCTSNLNLWVNLFAEVLQSFGVDTQANNLFEVLYTKALEGDSDAGGLLSYGYLSGEHITHFEDGRPLFVCSADSHFDLPNFMRVHLYSSFGALKIGLDKLLVDESMTIDNVIGHGGLFKTRGVGQRFLAAAMKSPVTVLDTAGEGGAWGIALLASYMLNKENDESLESFLRNKAFDNEKGHTLKPIIEDVQGFDKFMERYKNGLPIERAAVDYL